ncbi:hypothetical protein M0805_009007 [Coniferiporia weirii]|nr:hypothetical protein M0805_009007 [Coniferiporia weirii]
MTDSDIDAFLQQEVTFRLLSRKLSIHVNAAKNGLASFYARKREGSQQVYATFWVSGEADGRQAGGSDDQMDVDGGNVARVLTYKVAICEERDLEKTKLMFTKITSVHVYSLSTSSSIDESSLSGVSKAVREMDIAGGDKLAAIVGKITNQRISQTEVAGPSDKASSSAKPKASSSKQTSAPVTKKEEKPKATAQPAHPEKEKPKATGKLDWSKAKAKEVKKESSIAKAPAKAEDTKKAILADSQEKRGIKRKSSFMSLKVEEDDVDESTEMELKPASAPKPIKKEPSDTTRIKKGVILSDDEEELIGSKPEGSRKGKSRAMDDFSDGERSVRAMMDIDDSEVVKVPRSRTPPREDGDETEEPPQTDDAAVNEESDDPAPKAKPRKRKEKKVVPFGRNGLKKKRVVKSKTDFDEKGYMVTVDYSSYESVDEDEAEAEKEKFASKAKPKKAPAKDKKPIVKKPPPPQSESESEVKAPARNKGPAPSGAKAKKPTAKAPAPKGRSQKSLTSFFGGGSSKTKE